jgi:glycyl-tRNA synthetase beta chain
VDGAILGLADRIDTIAGCLGVGLLPTGSQDPYALRRQALGILTTLLGLGLRVSLGALLDRALDLLSAKLTEPRPATRERVLELLRTRLTTLMTSRGLRPDVVEAVLSQGFDDPVQALARAEALTGLMTHPDWDALVVTFKRTINILPPRPIGTVDPSRFVDEAERRLHAETAASMPAIRAALDREDYVAALTGLAALRPVVDGFFDAVMVMDRDPALQENRLALLKALADLVLPVGDLRKVQQAS